MATTRALMRHWRLKGVAQLAARHPRRLQRASARGSFAAVLCLTGLLLALVVAAVAGEGWLASGAATLAHAGLVPVLLIHLALSAAFYLAQGTLPHAIHTTVTVILVLPFALTLLLTGATDVYGTGERRFAWGLYGLALALWMVARSVRSRIGRVVCYSGPLVVLAFWSALGGSQQADDAAALAVIITAVAAIAVIPATLIARGVSDLPRVHVWAAGIERWVAPRPNAILWAVGVKVGLMLAYLGFGRWRFSDLNWVPDTLWQWVLSLAGAVFVIVPMRMARSRTLDLHLLRRIALALGVVVGAGLAVAVASALGAVLLASGRWWVLAAVTALFALAVAASGDGRLRRSGGVVVALLPPGAVFVESLVSGTGATAGQVPEYTMTWLLAGLLAGATSALGVVAWLAWRRGELWWAVRVVGLIGIWIALVSVLRMTGAGLAGVDIVLTVLLVVLVVWVRRHPRSRIAEIEVLALCGLPVLLLYVPDLVAGAPEASRTWILVGALVAPGVAALWHHVALDVQGGTPQHVAGLAGLAALYTMVACAVLVLGSDSAQVLPGAAEVALAYFAFPLSVLVIALLEQRRPDAVQRRVATGVA